MITDSDLSKKTKKTCEKISENMYIIANEPSLACFRIQEHVHKSVPQLIDKMHEMRRDQNRLKGNFYDLEYSISALKGMSGTEKHFQNIAELLKNSVFLKQQIDYEENVRMRVSANSVHNPMGASPASAGPNRRSFQRFSGSFDLPTSFIPASIASVSASASADLKDLRSVISHLATGTPPTNKRTRTGSLSFTQTTQPKSDDSKHVSNSQSIDK